MKIIVLNSKTKHKSKTMSKNLVLAFIPGFATAYMRKYPIHITPIKSATQNTL